MKSVVWNAAVSGAGAIFLSSCGDADYTTANMGQFLVENEEKVVEWIQREYQAGQFDQMIHIDFAPNDFGSLAGEQNKLKSPDSSSAPLKSLTSPLNFVELPSTAAALEFKSDYSNSKIWGSLRYRHNSSSRAIEAFEYLFGCKNGRAKAPQFKRTFLLGSGGSHGSDELDVFAQKLKMACGRGIDFAILGDSIARPGPLPKTQFRGLNKDGACIHFYQRQDILAGLAIQSCVNVKIEGETDHYSAAEMGRRVSRLLLDRLQMSESRWSLLPFSTSSQAFYFSDYHEARYSAEPEDVFKDLAANTYNRWNPALKYAQKVLVESPWLFDELIRNCSSSDFFLALARLSSSADSEVRPVFLKRLRRSAVARERAVSVLFLDFAKHEDATSELRLILEDQDLPIESKYVALEKINYAGSSKWIDLFEVALEYPEMHPYIDTNMYLSVFLILLASMDNDQMRIHTLEIEGLIDRMAHSSVRSIRRKAENFRRELQVFYSRYGGRN